VVAWILLTPLRLMLLLLPLLLQVLLRLGE
jgi:hypothetical protein